MFVHEQKPAAVLVEQLRKHRMMVRVSPRFGTRLDEKLSALGELVRASVHYYNTEEEMEQFCSVLTELVRQP
jgi:selenocysteine lyase/cysteine desulfurase